MLTAQILALPGSGGAGYILGLAEVFLLFFIMIGPVKSIGPFAAATAGLPNGKLRTTAFKVYLLCALTALIAGAVGGKLLQKWHIEPAILQLAGGLVFLLVALNVLLSQYRPTMDAAAHGSTSEPSIPHLAFPVTLPSYGIAALIVLVAMSTSTERLLWVLGIAQMVLLLDLVVMLVVRHLLNSVGQMALQILGAVLGMLQVALAIQLMVSALRHSGAWPSVA